MKSIVSRTLPLVALLIFCAGLLVWDAPLEFLKQAISNQGIFGYAAYVAILVAAVVFMPLTVMPVIPIAAAVLGPLPTAVLSIVGWTVGAGIAFLISRYLGRPVLERYIDLKTFDSVLNKIPPKTHFLFIVLLRMTMPVDLVSYALGLTKSLSFTSYIVATMVGVSWFSFSFAYMGEAFFGGDTIVFLEISLVSFGIFMISWYLVRRYNSDK